MTAAASPEPVLLAVDLGLTTGLALYGRDGRVRWYRSRHLANHSTLRRAARSLLGEPGLCSLWVEGGGALANVWTVEAARLGIPVTQVTAEAWRAELLLERDQRTGRTAKGRATVLARRVIEWSGRPRPTALRHDTAEAILVGLWAVWHIGWLTDIPAGLRS